MKFPRWYLKVWDGPVKVGYANCHIEPQVLYVDDLHIADDALRPASSFRHFIRRVLKQPNKPINYRNRGVGSALLRLIAKVATERGLRAVEGSLSQNDLEKNPALIAWYRRLGFAILPGGRHGSGIVRLELSAVSHECCQTAALRRIKRSLARNAVCGVFVRFALLR